VLEGEGRVKEYAGGYDDWLRQRQAEIPNIETENVSTKSRASTSPLPLAGTTKWSGQGVRAKAQVRRLTYKEQRELETLPEKIISLEAELSEIHTIMADPTFFRQSSDEIVKVKSQLQTLEKTIAEAYKRWEELEAI
jgi:ATP-binding cassette subfamily F protein uup